MKFKYPVEANNFKTFKVRCPIGNKETVLALLAEILTNNGGKDIKKTFASEGPTMFEMWIDTTFSKFMVETKLGEGIEGFTVSSPR